MNPASCIPQEEATIEPHLLIFIKKRKGNENISFNDFSYQVPRNSEKHWYI